MPPTIWLNKYLSNSWEVLALLRDGRRPDEFRLVCTHPHPGYAGSRSSDLFEPEPAGLNEAEYVDHCLNVARRHNVTLFLPGRNLAPIVRAKERFAASGTRILAAAD